MSWKKHFTPVNTKSELSPISGLSNSNNPGPARKNYSSFLPDVYTGSPNRIERYQQYEIMDSDPEINAALDILAEFCTHKLKDNKSPFTVKWRAKGSNSEVRILGEYLQQWNRLQEFDTKIFRIIRNTFKYGDSFFIRDPETQKWFWIDPSNLIKIIVNESDGKKPEQFVIKDLSPNFIDLVATQITPNINPRQTGGGISSGTGFYGAASPQRGTGGPYPNSTTGSRFGLSETEYAIDAEHVVHLSLSEGLDNNYPFGNSLLENIYKVYKQKELLEDAILIYRIQRAPERRVFHIDVGNMPSHLAMAFVERVKNEIHQRRIPSQSGGGANIIDSAYNPLCIDLATRIPLLDGRTLTLSDIISEFEQGKQNWVYSCDPTTGKIVPGPIDWAGVTRKNADVLKITLDNGETLVCTPDHTLVSKNNGFVKAHDCNVLDELMPYKNDNSIIIKIEKIDNMDTGTITVDGFEKYHNYHTFAIESGIFIKNSVSEDYFFPKTCLSLDQKIKLLDGRDITLQEIITEYENGKTNWTYSIDQTTKLIEPGKIVWAGVTRKNTQLIEVLLDNGEKVKVTPDHKFIMRDSTEKEAQYLSENDSLMPLYLHDATTSKNLGANKYLRYTCNLSGKKEWVHLMVCQKNKSGKETEIHHKNLNSLDNTPDNLIEMNTVDHRNLHRELGSYHLTNAWNDVTKRENIINGIRKYHDNASLQDKLMMKNRGFENGKNTWLNEDSKNKVLRALELNHKLVSRRKTINYTVDMAARMVELYNNGYDSISKITKILRTDSIFQRAFFIGNSDLLRDKNRPKEILPTDSSLHKLVKTIGYNNWSHFKETYRSNHKVVSIKWLIDHEDTGDITIESKNDCHNFSLSAGIFIHNSDGRGSDVTTLAGGCLAMDTSVSLLDGRDLTIQEIEKELKDGKEIWVYSCEPKTGVIVPGLVSWAGITQESAEVMKITLNNNEHFICTPDHKFPQYGGEFKRADEFNIGDSFIPLHGDFNKIISIEYLDEPMTVGTLTIDKDEKYHDYHTFGLSVGIMTRNSNLGEIDDLKFFTNKLFRGLRIPSSYLPTGADDSQASFNDGRVGTAYIQELRFNKYCERLQSLVTEIFDTEFKMYVYSRGLNIDANIFELQFNPPTNFASSRQATMDVDRINSFNTLQQLPFLSKRFIMRRYLGLTDEELAENERLWGEEQAKGTPTLTDAAGELRSAGLSAAGIEGDIGMAGDLSAPEDMQNEMPSDDGGMGDPGAPQTPMPQSAPPM